ncbi:patatin family protein [Candidatus Allofournierella merdipullorum]|uniref:patatin-like phospholipase family protein n=1 Tax=Candidatus Allofournierella merdipullorum TaxID=2838595 RepID=UPI002A8D5AE9|nr:patatin family protein [Candidatus Fournierella merdipullorum]
MKTGLVLEGGAMRGMFTAGVLDAFLAAGVKADEVVGVSAGALFGVNYLSGQRGRAVRYNKRFNGDKNYMGLRPLLKEGNLFSTAYAYDLVPRKLDPFDDETFQNSGVPFFAVVTDVDTGEARYVRIKSVFEQMDVLRASGSMPFVSRPVEWQGRRYLDGGIADSIPFQWMAARDCDRLIVVLTREEGYRKTPMNGAVLRLLGRKYPAIARRLAARHTDYNRALEELERRRAEGRAFVIRPSVKTPIRRIESDPEKLQQVYDLGVSDGQAALPALQAWLAGR